MTPIERYVPQGPNSLLSDAPGWSSSLQAASAGPVCWKCKGKGSVAEKIANKKRRKLLQGGPEHSNATTVTTKSCTVCHGTGFLSPKKKEMSSIASLPGMITMKRRCPTDGGGWQTFGPKAHAVSLSECRDHVVKQGSEEQADMNCGIKQAEQQHHPLVLLHKANNVDVVEAGVTVPPIAYPEYPWFPFSKGEQLCNLVGDWRILQRVGSHRWTTDDIVTAHVAIQEIVQQRINNSDSNKTCLKYLDLGCGNGSVLQMTSWGLIDKFDFQAFGIEARLEAVLLARRSLSFNIGKDQVGDKISVIHGDFRDLEEYPSLASGDQGRENHNDFGQVQEFHRVKEGKFDLVTGTPPYFQVDFTTEGDVQQQKVVTCAVINQGGMPTSVQSAPARCEFRGGIEEYCKAAASVLKKDGLFVVCENWLNNKRVYSGAKSSGLKVKTVYPVKGKRGRKECLFGVYVLEMDVGSGTGEDCPSADCVKEPLTVRTECGKWTTEYAELLEAMSIPAKHNSA